MLGNSHKNLLFRNHWVNSNQTLMEWSLESPLPTCPVIPTFNQDGCQTRTAGHIFGREPSNDYFIKI
jgi:hypothetical protein